MERRIRNYIIEELEELKNKEKMIDDRAIKKALDEGDFIKSIQELTELKINFFKYVQIREELIELDEKIETLGEVFAENEIKEESYRDVKSSLQAKKSKLEEELKQLAEEIISQDYEKPF